MHDREVAGVRRAIKWLHDRAKAMNDNHAAGVLNTAAFHLGLELKTIRTDCREPLGEDGKCRVCGWNSKTQSYETQSN
jgi:hypothetical protein